MLVLQRVLILGLFPAVSLLTASLFCLFFLQFLVSINDTKGRWTMLVIIHLTSETSRLRLHCFSVTSYSVLVYCCSPQSMQIKSFDLCTFPAANGTLNLILLLWSCGGTALRLDTVNRASAAAQEFITSSTICESNI